MTEVEHHGGASKASKETVREHGAGNFALGKETPGFGKQVPPKAGG